MPEYSKQFRDRSSSPEIRFTVFCKPEPQGSVRAFTPKGWKRPILTSDNKDLKSFRQEVAKAALLARQQAGFADLIFARYVPVAIAVNFYFRRPPSIPKKRQCHVVKPDIDKTCRSAFDALTGILFADDAQIISVRAAKHYGVPERVEIAVAEYTPSSIPIFQGEIA